MKLTKNFMNRVYQNGAYFGKSTVNGKYTYSLGFDIMDGKMIIVRRLTSDYGTTAMLSADGEETVKFSC